MNSPGLRNSNLINSYCTLGFSLVIRLYSLNSIMVIAAFFMALLNVYSLNSFSRKQNKSIPFKIKVCWQHAQCIMGVDVFLFGKMEDNSPFSQVR